MKKKILLIEDDPLVLKTVSDLLTRSGFEVTKAKSGEEAISIVENQSFDLIISDIRMPRIDGIQTVKRLKELQENQHSKKCPTIFITGYASEEAPIDAIKLGANDYLLKPFNIDELLASVKKHMEKDKSE